MNRISRYYDNMERRRFLLLFPTSAALLRAAENVVRGKLTKAPNGEPALQFPDGKLVLLSGDADTVGVLKDQRLANTDFEVVGQILPVGNSRSIRFTSAPCSHTRTASA